MNASRTGRSRGTAPASGALDVERLRQVKLMGFLRELERQEGRVATAALLGVNYKTVARALDEDRVTGRMADALELLLGSGRRHRAGDAAAAGAAAGGAGGGPGGTRRRGARGCVG